MSRYLIRVLTLVLVLQSYSGMSQRTVVSSRVDGLLQTTEFQQYDIIQKREAADGSSGVRQSVRHHEILQVDREKVGEIQSL